MSFYPTLEVLCRDVRIAWIGNPQTRCGRIATGNAYVCAKCAVAISSHFIFALPELPATSPLCLFNSDARAEVALRPPAIAAVGLLPVLLLSRAMRR